MLRRLRPGYLMAAFLTVSGCALFALILYGPLPQQSLAVHERNFIHFMVGFYIWLLVFYRLLIKTCRSGPTPDSSVAEWQPLEAADRKFDSREPMRGRSPVVFRISPWPWVKLIGYFIVLPMLGINLLIGVLAPPPWQQSPPIEQYAIALSTIPIAGLFGGFFLMHYRLLHFGIGSRACSYRIASPGSDMRSIVCHYEGSFPLDLIAGIWVREKLSPFLRWKELHYGLTFKDGDEMHLGVTTRNASWTGISDLKWERVLDELSPRTGIAIERHKHVAQSPKLSLV
jgi:hypothetical protein